MVSTATRLPALPHMTTSVANASSDTAYGHRLCSNGFVCYRMDASAIA